MDYFKTIILNSRAKNVIARDKVLKQSQEKDELSDEIASLRLQ